ncbi:MAG: restriction endonuclease subunit S [Desulfobacteraceae bacterium]|nr:restriction endonuclease subunit S [Desulfobacteraceae bacterium]
MDVKTFLAEFGHIVNAPGGVQRLREMVLQLAISAALTKRIKGDTTAKTLFDENQREKKKLVEKGIHPRPKTLTKINNSELPWVIPDTWMWCRLGDVTSYGAALKADINSIKKETWVLELEDIEKETSKLLQKIRAKDRKFKSSKNRFLKNDVLYGKLRPYLDKVILADEDGVCSSEIMPIRVFSGILPAYLRWYLKSPYFKNYANNSTHGMNLPRMGTESGRVALFPLAPIKEQKRIVAKVDGLMALCDRLETQQQKRSKLMKLARTASLNAMANAQTLYELKVAWKRMHENVEMLFEKPEDAKELRTAIYDLAVKGVLSQRSRDDSNINETLEKICSIKKELVLNKEIKKVKQVSPPLESEIPFSVPENWEWAKLDQIAKTMEYGTSQKAHNTPDGVPVLRMVNINDGKIDFTNLKYVNKDIKDLPRLYLKKFDLVFNRTNSYELVGRMASFEKDDDEFTFASYLIRVGIFVNLINSDFVNSYFQSSLCRKLQIEPNITVQTNQANFNGTKLRNVLIPLPPFEEQKRIVEKVKSLLALCDTLESQLTKARSTAEKLAKSAVAAITGTQLEDKQKMKAPKTELVTKLRLKKSPSTKEQAPLCIILSKQHNSELSAKSLWNYSGFTIDEFYRQLKTEMAKGWIDEPQKAEMRIVEEKEPVK